VLTKVPEASLGRWSLSSLLSYDIIEKIIVGNDRRCFLVPCDPVLAVQPNRNGCNSGGSSMISYVDLLRIELASVSVFTLVLE
jgi:hypothetical protein